MFNLLSDEAVRELYAMLRWWRRIVRPASRPTDAGRRLPATRRAFELTADLVPGGTADAVFLKWDALGDSGAGEYISTAETLVVSDPLNRSTGKSGDRGFARAIQAENGIVWEVTNNPGEIETQTVITAFQVTGTTLQVKTRSVRMIPDGDESAWTTVHTGTTCP